MTKGFTCIPVAMCGGVTMMSDQLCVWSDIMEDHLQKIIIISAQETDLCIKVYNLAS